MTTPTDLQVDAELEEDMTYPELKERVLQPAFAALFVEAHKRLQGQLLPAGAKVTISLSVATT